MKDESQQQVPPYEFEVAVMTPRKFSNMQRFLLFRECDKFFEELNVEDKYQSGYAVYWNEPKLPPPSQPVQGKEPEATHEQLQEQWLINNEPQPPLTEQGKDPLLATGEPYDSIKYILENHYINDPDPDIIFEIIKLFKSLPKEPSEEEIKEAYITWAKTEGDGYDNSPWFAAIQWLTSYKQKQ